MNDGIYFHTSKLEDYNNISILNKFVSKFVTLKLNKTQFKEFKNNYYEDLKYEFNITIKKHGILFFKKYIVYFGILDAIQQAKLDINLIEQNLASTIHC